MSDAMERLLDDWGWWARQRERAGYRCRSAEGRYRRPRVGEVEDAPRVVDVRACLAVERAVCHTDFPGEARTLLKGWYVLRVSREKIAAKAGIPRASFPERLAWAVTVLGNRLPV